MKKFKFLAICILISMITISGKIDRGYDALLVYDYFKAKKLFNKAYKGKSVAAAYGLSIIYGRNDNPFYNLDSAFKYIFNADTLFLNLDIRKKEKLSKLNIDSNTIQIWKDSIDFKVFEVVKRTNTIVGFQEYVEKHFNSIYKEEAKYKRDSLSFFIAKQSNTASSFLTFMEKYPGSYYKTEAKNRYEERLFYEMAVLNSEKEYSKFLKVYPDNPYAGQAQDSIFKLHTISNKIEKYYSFVKTYSENRNVAKSWNIIYKLYTSDYSPERIVEFQIDYPDYPFMEDLKVDLKLATKSFYPVTLNDKWGFMDQEGNLMIDYKYDFVEPFKEGLAIVFQNKKAGFINKSDQIVVPFEYDDAESFQNGIAVVSKNGQFGIINKINRVLVDFIYEEIGQVNSDLILVADENAYGYVNRKGKLKIPLKFKSAFDFKNGYALVKDSSKYGIINKHGDYVVESKYSWIESFNEIGRCKVKNDSLFGVLDINGGIVLPIIYDHIGSYSDSLILIAKNGRYGYANYQGEIVIPIEFEYKPSALIFGQFKNGFAKYLLKGKYGIINTKAEKIVPAMFEDIDEYNDTMLFAVKKRGKWGYSDQNLRLAIPYRFQYAKTFNHSKAIVKDNEMWFFINNEGQRSNNIDYESISELSSRLFIVQKKTLKGLLNANLEVILPNKYDEIVEYDSKTLRLEMDGEIMYYDIESKTVIKSRGL